jgi:hypothetical protein
MLLRRAPRAADAASTLRRLAEEDERRAANPPPPAPSARAARGFVVACVAADEAQAEAAADCAASMLAVLYDPATPVRFEVSAPTAVVPAVSAALAKLPWDQKPWASYAALGMAAARDSVSSSAALLHRLRTAAASAASSNATLVWLSPFALFLEEAAFSVLRGGCVMSLLHGLGMGSGGSRISTELLVVPPCRATCFAMVCGMAAGTLMAAGEWAAGPAGRIPPGSALTVDGALTQAAARAGLAVHPLSATTFPSCPRSQLPDAIPPGPLIVFAPPGGFPSVK